MTSGRVGWPSIASKGCRLQELRDSWIAEEERVVLFNPGMELTNSDGQPSSLPGIRAPGDLLNHLEG